MRKGKTPEIEPDLTGLSMKDLKILATFYKDLDWEWKSLALKELQLEHKMSRTTLQYRLERLKKKGLIDKQETYPVFYKSIRSHDLREQINKQYKKAIYGLLNAGGK